MRLKRVAWLGCLAPALGGCVPTLHGARDHLDEKLVAHTEAGIEHRIHTHARQAWRAVRAEFPRKVFTAEFRDGFLDGYADYLDRGGDAQPPAVPPARYTTNKKYFTPEGHALIRDYFLGFKYGTDVAVATGQRQFLTVPVLVPEAADAAPPVADEPIAPTIPPAAVPPMPAPMPLPKPKPVPTSDSPLVPRVPPLPPSVPSVPPVPPVSGIPGYHLSAWGNRPDDRRAAVPVGTGGVPTLHAPRKVDEKAPAVPDPGSSKFAPIPRPADVPTPESALPAIPVLASGAVSSLPTAPAPRSGFEVMLPEPPAEVPSLPAHLPTPPMMDDLPMLPPNFTVPPPLPANHPDPVRK